MKNDAELSPQQVAAVDLLALGQTITDTAAAVGASRQTVSAWLNRDADFQAALNCRQHELWRELSNRLRAMLPKVLDVLAAALDKGDVSTALTILKAAGPGIVAPTGTTDAAELRLQERERADQHELRDLLSHR